jgi:hypothetical protein
MFECFQSARGYGLAAQRSDEGPERLRDGVIILEWGIPYRSQVTLRGQGPGELTEDDPALHLRQALLVNVVSTWHALDEVVVELLGERAYQGFQKSFSTSQDSSPGHQGPRDQPRPPEKVQQEGPALRRVQFIGYTGQDLDLTPTKIEDAHIGSGSDPCLGPTKHVRGKMCCAAHQAVPVRPYERGRGRQGSMLDGCE